MIETREITLNPGESGPVAFSFTPVEVKTDDLGHIIPYYVSVNGLTGSFVAITLPAEFVVSDLMITPSIVYVGEEITISVLVRNIGGATGTATITLEIT